MRKAVTAKPAVDFLKPDTVISVAIDPATCLLATVGCPVKREEIYVAGSEPVEFCPKHGGADIKPLSPPLLPSPPLPLPSTEGQQPEAGTEISPISRVL